VPSLVCLILSFAAAAPLQGQDDPESFGKQVGVVVGEGFTSRDPWSRFRHLLPVQAAKTLTPEDLSASVRKLWDSNLFEDIGYRLRRWPVDETKVEVTFVVKPYRHIVKVDILGNLHFNKKDLESEALKVRSGQVVDPFRLSLDRRELERKYRKAGYHFAKVEMRIVPRGNDAEVQWWIFEGPPVQVDNIRVIGPAAELPEVDVVSHMTTKEWGIFRKSYFDEETLAQDMERIKWFLRLEGYLDIHAGDRVFVRDLKFSEDKKWVDISVYVDPGPLYRVRRVSFGGNTIFSSDTLLRSIEMPEGEPFSERTLYLAQRKIEEKYGETGHIRATIGIPWAVVPGTHEVDVVFAIVEGNPVRYGRVLIDGNWKTREDRIRLDLRKDVVPGEIVNQVRLERAKGRLRDRGWFEFGPEGLRTEFLETPDPDVQDLRLTVAEGRTARIQFAAGYSSAFGVVGLVEFSQRNFDLTDLPSSLSGIGEAFSGGGQVFSIRLSPGAQRQTYSVNFQEPYFFGSEIAFSLSLRAIETSREAYDESNRGGVIAFQRRFDNITLGLQYRNTTFEIQKVQAGAPPSIVALEGKNRIVSIQPALYVDTRDSQVIPTTGFRYEFSWTLVSTQFGADFDYYSISTEFQWHTRVYEVSPRRHHFINTKLSVSWLETFGDTMEIPIFDRLYAGGRGTIRGFDFRGVGPKEDGIPVGGTVLALATIEYNIPLYQNTVIGAFFVDAGILGGDWETIRSERVRVAVGFGFRFVVPTFGNIPIALDFGFATSSVKGDDEQVILFDLGRFF
jgi:outer membrane protein insertion porin family